MVDYFMYITGWIRNTRPQTWSEYHEFFGVNVTNIITFIFQMLRRFRCSCICSTCCIFTCGFNVTSFWVKWRCRDCVQKQIRSSLNAEHALCVKPCPRKPHFCASGRFYSYAHIRAALTWHIEQQICSRKERGSDFCNDNTWYLWHQSDVLGGIYRAKNELTCRPNDTMGPIFAQNGQGQLCGKQRIPYIFDIFSRVNTTVFLSLCKINIQFNCFGRFTDNHFESGGTFRNFTVKWFIQLLPFLAFSKKIYMLHALYFFFIFIFYMPAAFCLWPHDLKCDSTCVDRYTNRSVCLCVFPKVLASPVAIMSDLQNMCTSHHL